MFDPTDISAYGCYKRACYHRQDAGHIGNHLLRYAALEIRFAIERYLWETLDHLNPDLPSKRKRRLWSAGQLEAAIIGEDPDFVAKLSFVNLMIRAELIPAPRLSPLVQIPNLTDFDEYYGKVGNYLHSPKDGKRIAVEVEWWEKLKSIVTQTIQFLEPYVHAETVKFEVSDQARTIFEDFREKRLGDDDIVKALRSLS